MAAPTGNQFWKQRSKHGRDKIFATPEILWEAACEYFQWCEDNPFHTAEQRKGNIIIPKGVDISGIDLSPIVELPHMRPFTIQGLCAYIDCNSQYFNQFENSLKGSNSNDAQDFSLILTRIRETIYNQKFSGAASGFFNASIIARDLGLTDKKEIDKTVKKINFTDAG